MQLLVRQLSQHNWWSVVDGIILAGLAEGFRYWRSRPERVAKRRMDLVLKVAFELADGGELFDEVMLVKRACLDPLYVSQALKRTEELGLVGSRRMFDAEWSRPPAPDGLLYCDFLERRRWYGRKKVVPSPIEECRRGRNAG